MTKLNLNEAILTCHGSRFVRIEYSVARGEFEKDFPSILAAKAWCEAQGFKII
jgi:hypothetical protein